MLKVAFYWKIFIPTEQQIAWEKKQRDGQRNLWDTANHLRAQIYRSRECLRFTYIYTENLLVLSSQRDTAAVKFEFLSHL